MHSDLWDAVTSFIILLGAGVLLILALGSLSGCSIPDASKLHFDVCLRACGNKADTCMQGIAACADSLCKDNVWEKCFHQAIDCAATCAHDAQEELTQ